MTLMHNEYTKPVLAQASLRSVAKNDASIGSTLDLDKIVHAIFSDQYTINLQWNTNKDQIRQDKRKHYFHYAILDFLVSKQEQGK